MDAVNGWASDWLEPNKNIRTQKRYLCSIEQIEPLLGGKFIREIDGKVIADLIKARRLMGITNATIKRDLTALSSVFRYAIAQDWCENNPVLSRLHLIEEKRDPILLPQQSSIDLIICRCPGMIADIVRVAIATGARQEELLKARRDDVDHRLRQLTVVGKRNKRRTIDLGPFDGYSLIAGLAAHATSPLLFWHSNGERYKNFASQFAAIMARTVKWARAHHVAFQPFRFHDLRHLHAVRWLKDGRSIYDLQRRLGHTSVKTTEGYCEFLTSQEDRAVKGLGTKREAMSGGQ
jgi:integrase/recombinase XerD